MADLGQLLLGPIPGREIGVAKLLDQALDFRLAIGCRRGVAAFPPRPRTDEQHDATASAASPPADPRQRLWQKRWIFWIIHWITRTPRFPIGCALADRVKTMPPPPRHEQRGRLPDASRIPRLVRLGQAGKKGSRETAPIACTRNRRMFATILIGSIAAMSVLGVIFAFSEIGAQRRQRSRQPAAWPARLP